MSDTWTNAALRLFKAVVVGVGDGNDGGFDPQLTRTLNSGFVFTPNVAVTDGLIEAVEELYGRNSAAWNNSLHKSFAKVRDASIYRLRLEQVAHYFSTYGLEALGIESQWAYIPRERLDIPDLTEDLRVLVIRGLTEDQLREELRALLESGIALDEQSVADAAALARTFGGIVLADVRNNEVRCAMYHAAGMIPGDPVEFLRHLIYHATGKAMVIQSKELITELHSRSNLDLVRFFQAYEQGTGLHALSEIFLRYKPLFLALRTNDELRTYTNRIRRLATHGHRPLPEDVLGSITGRIAREEPIDFTQLVDALGKASVFRKIRLARALRYRAQPGADAIVHRIRNGKSYAREIDLDMNTRYGAVLLLVRGSIVDDLRPTVEGKTFFIPEGLHYALPASGKQFSGNIPLGSYVEVTGDMICGIHWTDVDGIRIDLDLALTNADSKIGWDGDYRSAEHDIQFSGDLTSAPKPLGASEVFRIGQRAFGTWLLHVNYFNFSEHTPVPFTIMAGNGKGSIDKRHVINPNEMIAGAHSTMAHRGRTLGIVIATGTTTRFYFAETGMKGVTSVRADGLTDVIRRALVHESMSGLDLREIFVDAGAVFVDSAADADVDLSPEVLTKSTIVDLLSGREARQTVSTA